jgi:chromosome segregation ATPase
MTDKRTENCLYFLRVPATDEGRSFIRQLKGYLNTDSYTYETRYTGKRPKGTNPVSTLKKNAESIRLYVRNKDRPFGANYDVNGHTHRLKVENEKLKKDIEALHKELDSSPSYNRLKVENRELKHNLDTFKDYDDAQDYFKMKEERDELDKLCMSQQVEIDRLDTKIDNEVCEGSCVSQEDFDEALKLLKEGSEEIKSLDKSKFSMREEITALNKSLAEAHASVSDLRDTVRDVREERDDAISTNRDLRIQLESTKEEESITHIKHHYLGSIPEDDVLYWMKIGYMFYNKVEGNDVKSNG